MKKISLLIVTALFAFTNGAWAQNDNDDTEITVNFKTPWNTPTCAIVELSRKFPYANIRVKYADEDIGSNCGWYALCKGDFVDDGYPSEGNAAIDFACNIWGYDADAYRAEMSLL